MALKICQNMVNILPNIQWSLKYCQTFDKILPKWPNFAKSGRTDWYRPRYVGTWCPSTPDFSDEVGSNLVLGLVTSCPSCQTAWWRAACCWLPGVKAREHGRHLIDQIPDWPNPCGFTKGVCFECLNRYVQIDQKPFGQSEIRSIWVLRWALAIPAIAIRGEWGFKKL